MSQAGELNVTQNHPEIPTTFDANTGSATPLANVLNIFGAAVAAGGTPVTTTASGNTLTVDVQRTTTSASSSAANAGLASFNSADFAVDANGYVTFTGTGSTETLTGNSGGAVSPSGGNINTVGTGSITIVGNPGTNTLTTQLTGLTNHDVLVGAGTATITSVSPSTAGFVLTSNGVAADPSFQAISASGAITTVTGNSGGAESPAAGNFNIVGTGSITTVGTAATETIQLTGLTAHNVLLGEGTATIGLVAPSATSGVPLISQGAAADPVFGTAVVAGGGTGDTSFTAYAVICGGTTSTGALQSIASVGTSGQVLTSNGASALPTFQAAAASGITTLTGDTGGAISPSAGNITLNANSNAGETVVFAGSGSTLSLKVTDTNNNTFIGSSSGVSGNTSGSNTSVGSSTFTALQATASGNSAFGVSAGSGITTGANNTFIGTFAGFAITTGSTNDVLGRSALSNQVGGGSFNICLGQSSGGNYTTTESSNILIGNVGVLAESNVLRIGTSGSGNAQQNKCFIAGVASVAVSSAQMVTINTSTGQMGSQAIPTAITWSIITADQTAVVNNGYICNKGSALLLTLPATAVVGDSIRVTGINTALGWKIVQSANQQIFFGNQSTTLGATGFLQSAAIGDSVEMVCVVAGASTVYNVISSVGNITVS